MTEGYTSLEQSFSFSQWGIRLVIYTCSCASPWLDTKAEFSLKFCAVFN